MTENELSFEVRRAAFKVHTVLGPGLLESAYETALAYELTKAGLVVARQVPVTVWYEGIDLGDCFRLDLLVNRKVVVEIKSVDTLHPVFFKQMLTYLRFSGCKLGQLINFNVSELKDHMHRLVNGL